MAIYTKVGLPAPYKPPTSKWRNLLYLVNGLTALLSVAVVGFSLYALDSHARLAIPLWAVHASLAVGFFMLALSGLGLCGARLAARMRANERLNWPLVVYFGLVGALMVVEVLAAGALFVMAGVLNDARNDRITRDVAELDSSVRHYVAGHPGQWVDVQDAFSCCGWNSTTLADDYPTGDACGEADALPCRKELLQEASEHATAIGAATVTLLIVQTTCLVASCCLLWQKPDGPDYDITSVDGL